MTWPICTGDTAVLCEAISIFTDLFLFHFRLDHGVDSWAPSRADEAPHSPGSLLHLCPSWLRRRGHVHSPLGIHCKPQLEIPGEHQHLVILHLWRLMFGPGAIIYSTTSLGNSAAHPSPAVHHVDVLVGVYNGMGVDAVWGMSVGLYNIWWAFYGAYHARVCACMVSGLYCPGSYCIATDNEAPFWAQRHLQFTCVW